MLDWLKGKSKKPTVDDLFETLRKCSRPSQQSGLFSTLSTLVFEDDRACSRICELELVEVLKRVDELGALASGCALLRVVTTTSDMPGLGKLGEQGAVNFVIELLGDNDNSDLFPDLCTALTGLSKHHFNKRRAKNLGVVTTLFDIFHKQKIEPDIMEYIVMALKAIMDLREDAVDDVSPYIPKLMYIMSTCIYCSEAPSDRHEQQANLACELGSFLAKSGSFATMMVDRGAVPLLVDLIPSGREERMPAYIQNVLRYLVSISKSHDLSLEALPSSMLQKLENIISGALDAARKLQSKNTTGKVVKGMVNAWLAAQVICALCDCHWKFMEKIVAGKCLRMLFDLLKLDFSQPLLNYGMVESEEMFILKRDLITVLEETCKSTRFHSSVRASGGLGALTSFMSQSGLNSTLKIHAERAIWNLEHCVSKSPVSTGSGNPLFENRIKRVSGEGHGIQADASDITRMDHPPLRLPVGSKRKANQVSCGTETAESARSRSRFFRQVPIFSSQPDMVNQEGRELSKGQTNTK